MSNNTAPETCGAAIEVPDLLSYEFIPVEERTLCPGATTSGWIIKELSVAGHCKGPLVEKVLMANSSSFAFMLPTEKVFTMVVFILCGAFTLVLLGPELPPENTLAIPAASKAFIKSTI